MEQLTKDDVLDLHAALKGFNGDFMALFKNRPARPQSLESLQIDTRYVENRYPDLNPRLPTVNYGLIALIGNHFQHTKQFRSNLRLAEFVDGYMRAWYSANPAFEIEQYLKGLRGA